MASKRRMDHRAKAQRETARQPLSAKPKGSPDAVMRDRSDVEAAEAGKAQGLDTDALSNRLRSLYGDVENSPQINPVGQLALEISRKLEAGIISQADVAAAGKALCDAALVQRAHALAAAAGSLDPADQAARFRKLVRATALADGVPIPFDRFRAQWERPREGIVFTGHPTFAMSGAMRAILVELAMAQAIPDQDAESRIRTRLASEPHRPDADLSLLSEHRDVQQAIGNARTAVSQLAEDILHVAADLYPDRWRELRPWPISIATWVGYDLDGRTDIHWADSLRFRLTEKTRRLTGLEAELRAMVRLSAGSTEPAQDQQSKDGIGPRDVRSDPAAALAILGRALDTVAATRAQAEAQVEAFAIDATNPAELSQAANELTRRHGNGLGASAGALVDLLEEALGNTREPAVARQLARLIGDLRENGLCTAAIHIRINAVQVHNAIRQPLGLETNADFTSRVLLRRLDQAIESVEPESVNFGTLAIEAATAIRQMMAIAQITKHIDSDTPIRLLIAECEQPTTVLAALYLARLFGVENRVDISPLMETAHALDLGAELISMLLSTASYPAYLRSRKKLCVETGFSDAGRFIGQVPAALAIERLHGQLARRMAAADFPDVGVLIFDTHGESMGRGAHHRSFADRVRYTMSPWIRERYRRHEVPLIHEVSVQGGDGYVLFGATPLATALLVELLDAAHSRPGSGAGLNDARKNPATAESETPGDGEDAFYSSYEFSRDAFERIKSYQSRLFENADYGTVLQAFATNLLPTTGSRKSKRQFDGTADGRAAAAEMRAIPHNAILQQLGFLANVVSGIGTTLGPERDRFADIHARSDRIERLTALVAGARSLSSIKTLVAYAGVFSDAFWVTRPLSPSESGLREACLYLASLLRRDRRHDAMMHLATYLRDDAFRLSDVLQACGAELPRDLSDDRVSLDVLHALRIALIQHIYLLAARIPSFSPRNDHTRSDVMAEVLRLDIPTAVMQLQEAFPAAPPELASFELDEPASYRGSTNGYRDLNSRLIEPMALAYRTILELSVGIAHHYRAHG